MFKPTCLPLMALLGGFLLSPALSEERQLESIFNGRDLAGWKSPPNNIWWSAADGVLHVKSGPKRKGSTLSTVQQYSDFIFQCDFKFVEGTIDSGIYLRNGSDQIQIGISGSLKRDMTGSPYIPRKGYPVEAKGVKDLLKLRDWNTMKIRAVGSEYTVWLNGSLVMTYQSDSAAKQGPIGIQLHGNRNMAIDFRNLKAVELKAQESSPADISEKPRRVLMIGDSISIQGYTKYAAETLKGEMVLHHHEGNAETTRNGLAKLDAWLAEAGGNWDIIHFNWGLWDLRSQGTNVPLAEYTANLEKLVARLKQTNATLIFATTTPVPPKNGFKRRDSDVQAYNAAAIAIMKREGIAINDLYGFIKPTLAEHQRKNDVHFNQAGYKRMGESVVRALRIAAKDHPAANQAIHTVQPNILVIVADDLGWADVGYHQSPIKTPVIDRLCREGVELDRHYVAPMCTPTRAALLTGRYWSRFGNTKPSNTRVLPWDTVTLAGALREAGYETGITGKWHLGSKPEWGPLKFGFDQSYGSLAGGVNPLTHCYKVGPYSRTWHRNEELIEESGHVTDLIAAEAVKFIQADRDKPFFLYVPFTAVHTPFDEPQEWLDRAAHLPEPRRQYGACTQHMDHAIGRIFSALRDCKQLANTLTVFFSDNGGTNGDDSLRFADTIAKGKEFGLNTPLRGWKTQVYEGGIRVPALVHWPQHLKPRILITAIHVTDWMPTLCSVAGCTITEDLKWDGRDIWPLLTDETHPPATRTLYCQGVNRKSAALLSGKWKLVVHGRGSKARYELFDLTTDPLEKTDLASFQIECVKMMTRQLAAEAAKDNDALPRG